MKCFIRICVVLSTVFVLGTPHPYTYLQPSEYYREQWKNHHEPSQFHQSSALRDDLRPSKHYRHPVNYKTHNKPGSQSNNYEIQYNSFAPEAILPNAADYSIESVNPYIIRKLSVPLTGNGHQIIHLAATGDPKDIKVVHVGPNNDITYDESDIPDSIKEILAKALAATRFKSKETHNDNQLSKDKAISIASDHSSQKPDKIPIQKKKAPKGSKVLTKPINDAPINQNHKNEKAPPKETTNSQVYKDLAKTTVTTTRENITATATAILSSKHDKFDGFAKEKNNINVRKPPAIVKPTPAHVERKPVPVHFNADDDDCDSPSVVSDPEAKPTTTPVIQPTLAHVDKPTPASIVKSTPALLNEELTADDYDSPSETPTALVVKPISYHIKPSPTPLPTPSHGVKPKPDHGVKPRPAHSVKPTLAPGVKPTLDPVDKTTQSPDLKSTSALINDESTADDCNSPVITPIVPDLKPAPGHDVKPTPIPIVKPTSALDIKTTPDHDVKPTPDHDVKPTSVPVDKFTPVSVDEATPVPDVKSTPPPINHESTADDCDSHIVTPRTPVVKTTPVHDVTSDRSDKPTPDHGLNATSAPVVKPTPALVDNLTPTPDVKSTPTPINHEPTTDDYVSPVVTPAAPGVKPTSAPVVKPTPAPDVKSTLASINHESTADDCDSPVVTSTAFGVKPTPAHDVKPAPTPIVETTPTSVDILTPAPVDKSTPAPIIAEPTTDDSDSYSVTPRAPSVKSTPAPVVKFTPEHGVKPTRSHGIKPTTAYDVNSTPATVVKPTPDDSVEPTPASIEHKPTPVDSTDGAQVTPKSIKPVQTPDDCDSPTVTSTDPVVKPTSATVIKSTLAPNKYKLTTVDTLVTRKLKKPVSTTDDYDSTEVTSPAHEKKTTSVSVVKPASKDDVSDPSILTKLLKSNNSVKKLIQGLQDSVNDTKHNKMTEAKEKKGLINDTVQNDTAKDSDLEEKEFTEDHQQVDDSKDNKSEEDMKKTNEVSSITAKHEKKHIVAQLIEDSKDNKSEKDVKKIDEVSSIDIKHEKHSEVAKQGDHLKNDKSEKDVNKTDQGSSITAKHEDSEVAKVIISEDAANIAKKEHLNPNSVETADIAENDPINPITFIVSLIRNALKGSDYVKRMLDKPNVQKFVEDFFQ